MSRWMSNSILGITLAACLVLPDLSAADDTAVTTAANAGDWGNFEVGSTIVRIELRGIDEDGDGVGERRPMDVLLWYPADKEAQPALSREPALSPVVSVPTRRTSGSSG